MLNTCGRCDIYFSYVEYACAYFFLYFFNCSHSVSLWGTYNQGKAEHWQADVIHMYINLTEDFVAAVLGVSSSTTCSLIHMCVCVCVPGDNS